MALSPGSELLGLTLTTSASPGPSRKRHSSGGYSAKETAKECAKHKRRLSPCSSPTSGPSTSNTTIDLTASDSGDEAYGHRRKQQKRGRFTIPVGSDVIFIDDLDEGVIFIDSGDEEEEIIVIDSDAEESTETRGNGDREDPIEIVEWEDRNVITETWDGVVDVEEDEDGGSGGGEEALEGGLRDGEEMDQRLNDGEEIDQGLSDREEVDESKAGSRSSSEMTFFGRETPRSSGWTQGSSGGDEDGRQGEEVERSESRSRSSSESTFLGWESPGYIGDWAESDADDDEDSSEQEMLQQGERNAECTRQSSYESREQSHTRSSSPGLFVDVAGTTPNIDRTRGSRVRAMPWSSASDRSRSRDFGSVSGSVPGSIPQEAQAIQGILAHEPDSASPEPPAKDKGKGVVREKDIGYLEIFGSKYGSKDFGLGQSDGDLRDDSDDGSEVEYTFPGNKDDGGVGDDTIDCSVGGNRLGVHNLQAQDATVAAAAHKSVGFEVNQQLPTPLSSQDSISTSTDKILVPSNASSSDAKRNPATAMPLKERKRLFYEKYQYTRRETLENLLSRLHAGIPDPKMPDECWLYTGSSIKSTSRTISTCITFRHEGDYHKVSINAACVALLLEGLLSKREIEGIINESWHASHLCGNWTCLNPVHICAEPGLINLNRNTCFRDIAGPCEHEPKCMKELKRKVRDLRPSVKDKDSSFESQPNPPQEENSSPQNQRSPAELLSRFGINLHNQRNTS